MEDGPDQGAYWSNFLGLTLFDAAAKIMSTLNQKEEEKDDKIILVLKEIRFVVQLDSSCVPSNLSS